MDIFNLDNFFVVFLFWLFFWLIVNNYLWKN